MRKPFVQAFLLPYKHYDKKQLYTNDYKYRNLTYSEKLNRHNVPRIDEEFDTTDDLSAIENSEKAMSDSESEPECLSVPSGSDEEIIRYV